MELVVRSRHIARIADRRERIDHLGMPAFIRVEARSTSISRT